MREVAFAPLPAVGPSNLPEETLPLDRFLYQLPNLLAHSVPRPPFPPFSILNEILRGGVDDAGMSGGARWTPFGIDSREYVDAIVALRARDSYTLDSPPDWVRSVRDWTSWKLETLYGQPPAVARTGLQRLSGKQVRTSADDELMSIALRYSNAQRAKDDDSVQAAEKSLEGFIEAHGRRS
jgi:hypothetical protein